MLYRYSLKAHPSVYLLYRRCTEGVFLCSVRKFSLDLFLNLRSLTNSVSQVVELCSSNLTGTNDVDLYYVRRVDREGLFNAATVGYASYGEGLGNAAAVLSDNGALEHLNSLSFTLADVDAYLYGIADVELSIVFFAPFFALLAASTTAPTGLAIPFLADLSITSVVCL